jgi:hypothetical protein
VYLKELLSCLGPTLETFNWALGEDGVYMIFDGLSVNAIAGSLVANAGGVGKVSTVALMTAAKMDEAASKLPAYRAFGG